MGNPILPEPSHRTDKSERYIIGAWSLVQMKGAHQLLADSVKPDYFRTPQLARIHAAACEVFRQGRIVNEVTIEQHLRDTGEHVSEVPEIIAECEKYVFERYDESAQHVDALQLAHWRRTYAVQVSRAGSIEQLRSIGREIDAVHQASEGESVSSINHFADEFWNTQQRIWSGEQVDGYPWGIATLDEVMPLEPGGLYIVGGSKGTGKTKLALSVIDEAVQAGVPCAIFSLEMPGRKIVHRLVSRRAEIDSSILMRRHTPRDLGPPIADTLDTLRRAPLHIDDDPLLTREELVGRVASWKCRYHVPGSCGIVCIDFLQRIQRDKARTDETDAVALRDTAYALAAAAKSAGVVILLIAQLNKQADGMEPSIGHLEGSGGPAQAADGVVLLDLVKTRSPVSPAADGGDDLNVIVAKAREGAGNETISCIADLRYGRFWESVDSQVATFVN